MSGFRAGAGGSTRRARTNALERDAEDLHGTQRPIFFADGHAGDYPDKLLAFHYLTENGVLAIQMWRGDFRDEELAASGTWTGVCHGQLPWRIEAQRRIKFVGDHVGAAFAGSGGVAALNHEAGNNAMEDRAGIKSALCSLASLRVGPHFPPLGQLDKILHRDRRLFLVEPGGNAAHGGHDCCVESVFPRRDYLGRHRRRRLRRQGNGDGQAIGG